MRTLLEVQNDIKNLNKKLIELKTEKAEIQNKKVFVVFKHNNLIKEYVLISVNKNTFKLKNEKGEIDTFADCSWNTSIFDTLDKAKEKLIKHKKEYVDRQERQFEKALIDFDKEIEIELLEEK